MQDDDSSYPPKAAVLLIAGYGLAVAKYFGDRLFIWLVYGPGAIAQGVHLVGTNSLSNGVQLSNGLRLSAFLIVVVLWIAAAYPVIRLTGFVYLQREDTRWAHVVWRVLRVLGWVWLAALVIGVLWSSR